MRHLHHTLSLWRRFAARHIAVCMLLIAPTHTAWSQTQTDDGLFHRDLKLVEFSTPTQWSFYKYIDNPVSLYKGIPDVSLTLYTVVDGDIEIPLTLRYNTSGIKVEEEAGWVGLGWNLNVGGYITRKVVDGYDDRDDTFNKYRELFHDESLGYVNTFGSIYMTKEMYDEIIYLDPETEHYHWGKLAPDVFYFSYPGNAGKYVTDWRDGSVSILQREHDILIDNDVPSGISGSPTDKTITTPDGVKHHFQYYDEVHTHESFIPISETFPLFRSVYPNGDEVSYSYISTSFARTKYSSYYAGNLPCLASPSATIFHSHSELLHDVSRLRGTESVLNTITTPNYLIVFESSLRQDNSSRKLDAILIKDRTSGTVLKKFTFSYEYFIPDRSVEEHRIEQEYRLKLTGVMEVSPTGTDSINEFSFGYNGITLPPKDSYNSDWWGYPNASSADNMAGQRAPDLSRLYKVKALRNSDYSYIQNMICAKYEKGHNYEYCQAGMLTSISYPTGGVTRFTYESNSFYGDLIPSTHETVPTPEYDEGEMSIQDRNNAADVKAGFFTLNEPATIYISYELGRGLNSWSDMEGSMIRIPYSTASTYPQTILDFSQQCYELAQSGSTQSKITGSLTLERGAGVTTFEVLLPDALGDQHYTASSNHGYLNATIRYRTQTCEVETVGTSYGCGMRVASITHHDSPTGPAVKTVSYSYADPSTGLTSGHLFDVPKLENIYEDAGYSCVPSGSTVLEPYIIPARQFEVFDTPINTNPYARSDGVGYGYVTVTVSGIPGKTVYRFKNDDAYDTNFSYRVGTALNGKLLSQTDFDEEENIVRSISYTYTDIVSKHYCGVNLINQWNLFPGLINPSSQYWLVMDFERYWPAYYSGVYSVLRYELNQHDILLLSETSTQDGMSVTTTYTYDPQTLLKRSSSVTGSDGSVLKTTYSHPGDYSFFPYNVMTYRHIISPVVETRMLRNSQLVDAVLTTYDDMGFMEGRYIGKVTSGTSPLTSAFVNTYPNPVIYPSAALTIDSRDERGNPLQATLGGTDPVSYTWGYGGRYPTSETKGSTDSSPLTSTYTYDGLGNMLSYTDPAGHILKWTYDVFGRLSSSSRMNGTEQETTDSFLYGVDWMSHSTTVSAHGTKVTDKVWFTGLGLPDQELNIGATPSGKTRVKPYVYDAALRESQERLPYALSSATGDKQTAPLQAQTGYWDDRFPGESTPWASLEYEGSPVSRVETRYEPGDVFRTAERGTQYGYRTNEDEEVRKINASASSGAFYLSGYWETGVLHAESITDPDSRKTIVYTDRFGQKILERRFLTDSVTADTYYVYDGMLNLRYVIPPKASAQLGTSASYTSESSFSKEETYFFVYDNMHRMVEVRKPGAEAEYFVYDDADRIVASQNAHERARNIWRCSIYGDNGLLYGVHMLSSTLSRAEVQNIWPISEYYPPVLSYGYGDYPGQPSGLEFQPVAGVVSESDLSDMTTGLKTFERIAAAESYTQSSPSYDSRYLYYDNMGRLIQSVEQTLSGHIVRTSWKYDYRGNVLKRCEQASGITKLQEWNYDERGRRMAELTSMNGTNVASISYSYDDLDRVKMKLLANGMREETEYNLQGWLAFSEVLNRRMPLYTDLLRYYDSYFESKPAYSGNISSRTVWQVGTGQSTRLYTYDGLDRLTDAEYFSGASSSNRFTERGISYDLSGNILTLRRYMNGALTDNLSFSYTGNRRAGYSYDQSGNLVSKAGAGHTVSYNVLNLPQTLREASDSTTILSQYSYLFDGTKVSVTNDSAPDFLYLGSMRFTSTGGTPAFESTDFGEGRIVMGGNGFETEYHHKDYLSNVRVITDSSGELVASYEYLPFGTPISLGGREITGGDHLLTGKEKQSVGATFDFGARHYDYSAATWTSQEPLYSKFYSYSPYSYCVGNPIRRVDQDGKFPALLIPVVKGIVGAAVDVGTQITVSMASGRTFGEALSEIDVVSVGTSFMTSTFAVPGGSVLKKIALPVLTSSVDAIVDVSVKDGLEFVGLNKEIPESVTDFVFGIASILPGKAVDRFSSKVSKEIKEVLNSNVASTYTKEYKNYLKKQIVFFESEQLKAPLETVLDYPIGIIGGMISGTLEDDLDKEREPFLNQ